MLEGEKSPSSGKKTKEDEVKCQENEGKEIATSSTNNSKHKELLQTKSLSL